MYAGYQYRNSEKVSRLQSCSFLSAEADVLSFPARPQWRNFVRLYQRTLDPRPRLTCPVICRVSSGVSFSVSERSRFLPWSFSPTASSLLVGVSPHPFSLSNY